MECHLVVIVHGLWGNAKHLAVLEDELRAYKPPHHEPSSSSAAPTPREAPIFVLNIKGNSKFRTHDGIDLCAARAVLEIDAEIERLANEGKKVAYYSMSGFSMGGLVSRYALGILHARTPSFFTGIKPLCFSTFGSPWLGMPRYNTRRNDITTSLGLTFLSRTGTQFYLTDEEQLIMRLARKGDIFLQALSLFDKIDIYANAIYDGAVSYPTGSVSLVDPFKEFKTNGIEIELEPGYPLIKSYHLPPSSPLPTENSSSKPTSSSSVSSTPPPAYPDQRTSSLPPKLRFPFPLNVLFLGTLPIIAPIAFGGAYLHFMRENWMGRRRLGRKESEELWKSLKSVENPLSGVEEGGSGKGKSSTVEVQIGEGFGAGEKKTEKKIIKRGDLMLTDLQIEAVETLSSLPQLKRHIAWLPHAFNSHETIIAQNPGPDEEAGRLIQRHWVERMLLE